VDGGGGEEGGGFCEVGVEEGKRYRGVWFD
jgi:hypothetical protein